MNEAVGPTKSSQSTPAHEVIRFGNFEVDLRAGELRRGGIRLKLSGQPFDVLVALLEKPGQVVTREELHDKLWAQDTFVDFEHGLNKAINKVREALRDTADNPRFIETLPRRGYRFVAPVTPAAKEELVAGSAAQPETPAPVSPVPTKAWRWFWGFALALLLIIAVLIAIESRQPANPRVLSYTQLTNDGLKKTAGVSASLATDGSRIYFGEQDSQGGLMAEVSVTGGSVSTVARFPEVPVSALDYSPDRSELLFDVGHFVPLWALRVPDGLARRRIGDFAVNDVASAAWSPDGQSIAYGSADKLMLVRADGTQARQLAAMSAEDPLYPRWSPDGKLLRFSAGSASGGRLSIWEIAADGSNLHPLFSDWQSRNDYGGSWTPDGKYFVYASVGPHNQGSIFALREGHSLLRKSTAQPVQLTSGPMSFSPPLPSRDGKKIFTIGFLDQGDLVRYQRATHTWVSYLNGISAADLDFSHDGEWVNYVLVPEGTLWRSRVDGTEQLQLTIPPMRTSLPRWSPDGKQIVFAALRPGGAWTIYLVSADGGEPQQLVPEANFYQDPTWSPDGKRDYLASRS